MRIDILTLFPGMFRGILDHSILKRGIEGGHLDVRLHDLRDWSDDPHRKVDDRPYGGGPGMVLKPEPVFAAVEGIEKIDPAPATRILLTPQGERFTQTIARDLAARDRLLLICGHYEGFDERIRTGLAPREISIGDFVLTGGEIPAMALLDAVARLLPGVLGDATSADEESFSDGLLEGPHYTRPPDFRGMEVPEILRSGDHAAIAAWRREQACKRTRERRPDLPGAGAAD